MANVSRGTTLQLSATELRALTNWPDAVIVEFLSLQANNYVSGSVVIPLGDTSVTVTASVNATSIIMATVAQADTTMKSCAAAMRAAFSICSRVASGWPNAMFDATVLENKKLS